VSRERPFQLGGAGALRRALGALDALAAPAGGLLRAGGAVDELAVAGPRELAAAPVAVALGRALDELDGAAAAPAARAVDRPRRGARIAPPASAANGGRAVDAAGLPTRTRAPSASNAPRAPSAPRSIDGAGEAAAGRAALAAVWPAPDDAGAAANRRRHLRGDGEPVVPPAARRRPLPGDGASSPTRETDHAALARLVDEVPGAAAARALVLAPVRAPRPAASRAPVNAPRPRPDAPLVPGDPPALRPQPAPRNLPPAAATPATPPRAPGPPASPPRGLRGLASWWHDRGETPAGAPVIAALPESASHAPASALPAAALAAPTAPAAPAARPSPVLEPSAPAPVQRFAGLDALLPALPTAPAALAPRRFAPAMSALDNLDEVTHALERVLVRELRRHGVTPEEP
jgi:hypothetical protein